MRSYIKKLLLLLLITSAFYAKHSSAQIVAVPSVQKDKFLREGKKFRFGKFSILPSLLLKDSIDNNALYSDKNGVVDNIIDVQPGFDLIGHGSKLDVMLGYKLNVHENFKYDTQDYIAHDFGGEFFSTHFGKRVFIRLADYLKKTSEPADVEILDRMGIFSNEAATEVGYVAPGEDLELSIGYVNNFGKYSEIWNGSNFYGNGIELKSKINLSFRYRFLPKTQATFDFSYTRANQSFGEDVYGGDVTSNGFRTEVGVTGAFTRRLSLHVKLGYTRIAFNINETASNFITETGFSYNLTRKLTLQAGYARRVNYTIYSPYNVINNYNLGVGYAFHKKWKVNLKVDFDDISFSGPIDNGAGERRSDFDTRLQIDIVYRLKEWFSIISGYRLENRSSNMLGYLQGTGSADFLRNLFYIGFGFNYF